MFDCLVDGSTVLGYGAEYKFDKDLKQHVEELDKPPEEWEVIAHLDFKPQNGKLFRLRRNHNHFSNILCSYGSEPKKAAPDSNPQGKLPHKLN